MEFRFLTIFFLFITVATVDTTRYYSEIQKVDKPNNYEDLKIYTEI